MDTERAFRAFREVQLAYVGIRLGLFKALDGRAMSVEQLAEQVRIPADRMKRLVRGFVWGNFIERAGEGNLRLTQSGKTLVDDRPLSAADNVMFQAEFFYPAWSGLYEYAIKGSVPFIAATGEGVFETLQRDARLAKLYAAPMAARSFEYSGLVAKRKEFEAAEVIVDVGGGHGRLVVDVLKARWGARGVVFDLPAMRESAEKLIADQGMVGRCMFEAGDVFKDRPPAADVYLLKWVLHDFGDEESVAILKSIGSVMGSSARLLVIERLMPEEGTPPAGLANADMNMLALSGGGERSRTEYESLMRAAGLEMAGCDALEAKYGFYVMSARRSRQDEPRKREDAEEDAKKT